MKYTKFQNGAYNIHLINTDKFKTINLRINFKRKVLKDEITKRNLLTRVLLESNEFYKTSRLIEIETEKLYGLLLRSSASISGNYSIMCFESSFLNEEYTEDGAFDKSLEFILGFIFNPNIIDNGFSLDVFNYCKDSLRDEILSIKENPSRYGMFRMFEEMDSSEPYSFCPDGYVDDLESITREELYTYYKEVVKSDLIDIFVIGDFDNSKIKDVINSRFRINTLKRPTGSHYVVHKKINKKSKTKVESMDLEQSKLFVGCKISDLTPFEQKYVMNIYSFILGGSPNSKLFMNLREKNSLCYFVSSSYQPVFNLLVVRVGIDACNFKKSVLLIKEEMKNIEQGNFDDSFIEAGIITYKNTFKEVFDSAFSILNSYMSCEYLNFDPIDKRVVEIEKVTRDDVIRVAKKIHLDTIFLLEGDKYEED